MNNLLRKKTNELSKKKKKGFTLVELVIVIAIIAILAAMAIPKLGSMRTNARVSNDVAAAKNIATIAATMVANGSLPAATYDLSDGTNTSSKAILGQLSGKVAGSGKTEATNTAFSITVASNGDITVSATGTGSSKTSHQLYPDSDGAGRTAYAGDIG